MNGKFSESNESLTAVRGKHIQFKLDIKKKPTPGNMEWSA